MNINIELTLKQHAYIIAFLPSRGEKDIIKYIIQVANKMTLPAADSQLIVVNVPEQLILDIYSIMSMQQERLTAQMNDDLRSKLLLQVGTNANIMQGLGVIASANTNELSKVVEVGKNFLIEIKP